MRFVDRLLVIRLITPSSVAVPQFDQFVVVRSGFCWSTKPVDGDGQEITTEFVLIRVKVRGGALLAFGQTGP